MTEPHPPDPHRPRAGFSRMLACAVIVAAAGSASPPVRAQQVPGIDFLTDAAEGWEVSGSNTLRLEEYLVGGDQSASRYQFEGFQPYDDFELSFARQIGDYEEVRGDVAGVMNESPYRATDQGLSFERANLTWEKGDARVPYRLELGDYYGYFSFRTLQRSLKGVQVDLQPVERSGGARHAFQVMSGFSDATWRNVDPGRDLYSGASWLIETDRFGRFALNAVQNHREADIAAGSPGLDQWVFSVAGAQAFRLLGQQLNVEGELARFNGDIDLGAVSRTGETANGIFLALQGRSEAPLTYSARFQDYGDDFRPNGAVITPNRRGLELRGGYDFGEGRRLDGRIEDFTDNLQHGTARDTRVYGVTAQTPLPNALVSGATLRFDGFVQDVESGGGTTMQKTMSANVDIAAPIDETWSGRFGLNLANSEDEVTGSKSITRQVNLSADRAVSLYGFRGTLTPGLLLRTQNGPGESDDFGPSVAVSLARGPHSLNANYAVLLLHRNSGNSVDSHDINASYGFSRGAQTFGAELDFQHRVPDGSEELTNSYRIAAFWRISFHKPAHIPTPGGAPPPAPADATQPAEFRLPAVPPALALDEARLRLGRAGIVGGLDQPGVTVYEVRLLSDIDQRQRLAVTHAGGRVVKTALVIDFDDPASTASVTRTLNRVQEELIRRYGPPSSTFNLGAVSTGFVADVNRGTFIRNVEWRTAAGTIRFGVPRRLDRRVRIEVQLARSFAPPRDTLWSIEAVR